MNYILKLLCTIIGLFLLHTSIAQTLQKDTIIVKRNVHTAQTQLDTILVDGGIDIEKDPILIKTCFIPHSVKMIELLNEGITPIDFKSFEDEKNIHFKEYPKFLNTTLQENVLTVKVAISGYCCHNFLGEAEIVDQNTLNLLYISYGGFCACNCISTLQYRLKVNNDQLKYITINGSKIKAKIIQK